MVVVLCKVIIADGGKRIKNILHIHARTHARMSVLSLKVIYYTFFHKSFNSVKQRVT